MTEPSAAHCVIIVLQLSLNYLRCCCCDGPINRSRLTVERRRFAESIRHHDTESSNDSRSQLCCRIWAFEYDEFQYKLSFADASFPFLISPSLRYGLLIISINFCVSRLMFFDQSRLRWRNEKEKTRKLSWIWNKTPCEWAREDRVACSLMLIS